MRLTYAAALLSIALLPAAGTEDLSELPFPIWNVVPPLYDTDDPLSMLASPE